MVQNSEQQQHSNKNLEMKFIFLNLETKIWNKMPFIFGMKDFYR